jgi:hypothetical protein
VLNLDAELELARGGGPYQTPLSVARGIAPALPKAEALLGPDDALVESDGSLRMPAAVGGGRAPSSVRWLGAAWSPTPSALARLARAGVEPPPSPGFAVLQRVNHRRFYLELGGGAPGARYVRDEAELTATLAERRVWLCKRPFGFAGRGQRRLPLSPSADDRRWLADGLRQGGFVAEPWLEVRLELALHGLLEDGRLGLGHVCVQQTDSYRAWVSTRRASPDELSPSHVAELSERAERVGAALADAGYFGPFGVDAYLYETASGALALNSLSELNARFSMGYPVGAPRVDAEPRARRHP